MGSGVGGAGGEGCRQVNERAGGGGVGREEASAYRTRDLFMGACNPVRQFLLGSMPHTFLTCCPLPVLSISFLNRSTPVRPSSLSLQGACMPLRQSPP